MNTQVDARTYNTAAKDFAEHRIVSHTIYKEGAIEELIFRRPGTNCFGLTFLRYHNTLVILGDIGAVTFHWYGGKIDLAWIAECNFGYYLGKLQAFSEDIHVFDTNAAIKDMEEFIKEHEEEPEDYPDIRKRYVDVCYGSMFEDKHTFTEWLRESASDVYEDVWDSSLPDCGQRIHPKLYMQYIGLKTACNLLREQDRS